MNRVVPDEMVGAWVTSAPGYADRALEISKAAILFGTDSGETTVHDIWNFEQMREGRRTLYTFYYTTEEGLEEKFAFYYEPANGGVIRLKNQEGVA